MLKVREAGRVVGVHTLIATGVNAEGYREILGIQVTSAEDGAGWLAFFRDLVARGLSGVALVTSDAHAGLVAAIGATLPAAAWQRCRTHYAANLMAATPKPSWPWVRTLLHSIYDQPIGCVVGSAALPGRCGQGGADRGHQAGVGVAGDQRDPGQAAGDQVAEERQPAGPVLGGGDLDAQDLSVALGVDAGGDQGVHPDDAACLAHLEHQRRRREGIRAGIERAGPKRLYGFVELFWP